jgi:Tfp pilus assembly protein PilN
LLVDLGRTAAGIDFISGGQPRLSWSDAIDDPHWSDAPGAHAADGPTAEAAREAAARLGDALATRLASPLFRESLPGGVIPQIHVGGYGANRRQVLERLQTQLKSPVRVFSPWPLVRWSTPPADLTPFTSSLALAFAGFGPLSAGLELEPERQDALHRAPSLRLSAALALALGAVLVAHLAAHGVRQQRQHSLADREIRALKTKMAGIERISKEARARRARLDYLQETVEGRLRPSEVLRELTMLLPDSAYLNELTFKGRTVEISGLAPAASQLLTLLEASPLFSGVEFSAPIVAQGAGLERFRIRMKLEVAGG